MNAMTRSPWVMNARRTTPRRTMPLAQRCEWIVCDAGRADPVDGTVICPLSGAVLPIDECLECHHLLAISNDRALEASCTTGDD